MAVDLQKALQELRASPAPLDPRGLAKPPAAAVEPAPAADIPTAPLAPLPPLVDVLGETEPNEFPGFDPEHLRFTTKPANLRVKMRAEHLCAPPHGHFSCRTVPHVTAPLAAAAIASVACRNAS